MSTKRVIIVQSKLCNVAVTEPRGVYMNAVHVDQVVRMDHKLGPLGRRAATWCNARASVAVEWHDHRRNPVCRSLPFVDPLNPIKRDHRCLRASVDFALRSSSYIPKCCVDQYPVVTRVRGTFRCAPRFVWPGFYCYRCCLILRRIHNTVV